MKTTNKLTKASEMQAGRRPDLMIKTMPEPRRGSQLGQSDAEAKVPRRGTSTQAMSYRDNSNITYKQ
jgi:hypothetical protein